MRLLKRLFGNNEEPKMKNVNREMIGSDPVSKKDLIIQSEIPASCGIGNLVFEKKYREAVELGLKLLEDTPNDPGVLINLMDAYFKGKETVALDYIAKSTYYAKQAILTGHNTGYAEQRLAINLDKAKMFHQSLQLYSLILETEGFHFSSHGCGNSIDWNHRKESILNKMDKAVDNEDDVLFSQEEISKIIQIIKDKDDKERREKERYDRLMIEMEKAQEKGDYEKLGKLLEELHKPCSE